MTTSAQQATQTESGADYARRIHAERVAAGKCGACWGHGTIVVPHYSHSCGVETDRVVGCKRCGGTGKSK